MTRHDSLSTRGGSEGRALVIIPKTRNFFNNVAGRRLAEALAALGWQVRTTTLADCDGHPADVAFLVSLAELFGAIGDEGAARRKVEALQRRCPHTVLWLLEPTKTPWFDHAFSLFQECGLGLLADNALHDQSANLTPQQVPRYRHLFYGLTQAEKQSMRRANPDRSGRPIPWVFFGWKTPPRCELARRLVETIDPAGLLYLTDVLPITETGPHLQDQTVLKILRKARYQIWRAHHSSFYMEGERYRQSALAGCVPFKIVCEDEPASRAGFPFPESLIRQEEIADALAPDRFEGLRARFLQDYLRRPSLEEELARLLVEMRLPATVEAARAA